MRERVRHLEQERFPQIPGMISIKTLVAFRNFEGPLKRFHVRTIDDLKGFMGTVPLRHISRLPEFDSLVIREIYGSIRTYEKNKKAVKAGRKIQPQDLQTFDTPWGKVVAVGEGTPVQFAPILDWLSQRVFTYYLERKRESGSKDRIRVPFKLKPDDIRVIRANLRLLNALLGFNKRLVRKKSTYYITNLA